MVRWTKASVLLRRELSSATSTSRFSSSTPLLQQTSKMTKRKKSLALSVYFKQPDFGMQEYEILSRATAYLLGIDPRPSSSESKEAAFSTNKNPYAHLTVAEYEREQKQFQFEQGYTPVQGRNRNVMDLNWLEFIPQEFRPRVHVVCSSHVVAPFLWRDYYSAQWLTHVKPEHCTYFVEVYDNSNNDNNDDNHDDSIKEHRSNNALLPSPFASPSLEPLAKFALHTDPFHHPEGQDVALLHLMDEEQSLRQLETLGVDILYERNNDKLYQKGETLMFEGFLVAEANRVDDEDNESWKKNRNNDNSSKDASQDDDVRVFYPYAQQGTLAYHTNERFFAITTELLPEGMCGAPVLDDDGDLCGTVLGIVPPLSDTTTTSSSTTTNNEHNQKKNQNKLLAGCAAFMPSYMMKLFIDYVQRGMLEQLMPDDMFQMVVTAKKTNSIAGPGLFMEDGEGGMKSINWEEAFNKTKEILKKKYTPKEVEAVLHVVANEEKEVMEIFEKEGGDLDEIIYRVRRKTFKIYEMVREERRKQEKELQKQQQKQQVQDDSHSHASSKPDSNTIG